MIQQDRDTNSGAFLFSLKQRISEKSRMALGLASVWRHILGRQ